MSEDDSSRPLRGRKRADCFAVLARESDLDLYEILLE